MNYQDPTLILRKGEPDELERLRAEVERLRADVELLDWLEENRPVLWGLWREGVGHYWIVTDFDGYSEESCDEHKTARAAIDAARAQGGAK